MSIDVARQVIPWRSPLLSAVPGVVHGVSQRREGFGRAHGNVGFSAPRDREDAWVMRQHWCSGLGLAAERIVTVSQVHGPDVHIAAGQHTGRGARPGSSPIGRGDALITNQIGPVLMTLHADCQPILFVDPGGGRRGPAVGVAHAGWRGTVADVAGSTVALMTAAFGTRPKDVQVCLGPAIGQCCYDVGDDVIRAWREQAGSDAEAAIEARGNHYRFSLTDANALLLDRAAVRPANIEASRICTKCDGDHWFSHRGQGPHTGRFGAIVSILGAEVPR